MRSRLKRTYIYIKSNLNNISSIASIICLIDCILIPLITVLISIYDVVIGSQNGHSSGGDDDHDHAHGWEEIVERIALYVMTPIISITTIYNFIQLKNMYLLLTTLLGIALFVLSHAHINFGKENVNKFIKSVHLPMAIFAAICLIGTNYVAHKLLKSKNLDSCCNHKKLKNHLTPQSSTTDHALAMNEDNNDMHNHACNNGHVTNMEKYYHIGFQQNNEHELVRFL
ncbi:hypothetical protein AK88_02805 [Plasmodium fragile]|uniref:MerC domain-containing protein n=1 Tax=Plasmodium fragile TaxID=5857 RepID=A0A0D9QP61_PLAFR|nr:uncharacterized protein AK88_02805 [Plasmodium fragile]KJP87501.1 hypothetical protein AK88_02805 [Plasmodium fragile]